MVVSSAGDADKLRLYDTIPKFACSQSGFKCKLTHHILRVAIATFVGNITYIKLSYGQKVYDLGNSCTNAVPMKAYAKAFFVDIPKMSGRTVKFLVKKRCVKCGIWILIYIIA